ncbi:MAG: ribonuclease Z [bacterium]|jgi:ribonuclease Z
MFGVTILGNNSALSMHGRHQTAQVVTIDNHLFLVDCGESTQIQMQRYKIRKSKIDHIFISHLHGDHYYGLPGLLNTYGLTNRVDPLHLYAVPELKEIIELQLRVSDSAFGFEFIFHPITETAVLLELPGVTVSCFPVSHRIPCWGFLFRSAEKSERVKDDKTVRASLPSMSYAFCADTKYDESIIPAINNADLIYHESTYLDDQTEKASARFHCTSSQAAMIAKKSGGKRLLLGHFSSKYEDISAFEIEARNTFMNTEVSREGVTYLISPVI